MIFQGAAQVVGDNIDTDVILPGRYLTLTDPVQLAQHVFEGIDPDFVSRVKPGDILIAGSNFGSGSSREHAPIGLKALGISCVIAASFARIFYRNAINLGLPILIAPEAARAAKPGDQIRVDTDSGSIEVAGQVFSAQPFPPFVQELIAAGGLVPWVRDELARR